ncbi:MAG: DUF2642 domain-containing protein [Acidibacillus sp.]|uniref:DUF2642 domain-containing protein n=1 Tax=Sulfoacidibacillus ferrooxidans TaxID=2005001 RepID=A0A9X2AEC5_9BACL|nr:DUF2642 domain-containing protein [Sulfoacidibacillus ferrooxidans]MCI0182966.1 hypothetical protein [Sulfoacidibacillus ferrooxidans]MCY0893462.1 DUF2642 domain-containing protein [Acidibacillus sp.]
MIRRQHLHQYIGQPVLVHTTMGTYRGHLHSITNSHIHLHGHRLVSATHQDQPWNTTLSELPTKDIELVYFPGAALALPIAAIVGVTALGLGAMSGW